MMLNRDIRKLLIFGIFIYAMISHPCFAQNGLVAHWDFEEIGAFSTSDIIGGLTAYTFGAEFVSDPAPGGGSYALFCDTGSPSGSGSSDIGFNINLDSFSVSAWVKTTGTAGSRIVTVSSGAGPTGQAYWLDITNGGLFGVQIEAAIPLQISSNNGESLADGEYHYLVGVHDAINKEIRLYIDGELTASSSTAGLSGVVGWGSFSFCGISNSAIFRGYVDEIKIFNRVLSNSEILQEANPSDNSISLQEALDNSVLFWSSSGSNDWFGQNATTYDQVDAAVSGDITDSQVSSLETTVTGPGDLSFYWKVSSEENYDYLEFYIDNVRQLGISGEVDWQQRSFSVPAGQHQLKWSYSKGFSSSYASDAGFLDNVVFENDKSSSLGDLAVSVSSVNKIFRSGKNNDFLVTINNLGDTQINDASVFITHDLGFEKFLWRNLWFCGEGSESCTHISTNTDKEAETTTAEFRVSLPAKTAALIQGRGEFEGYDGVRVTATVSGGTPFDPNPENNAASMVISPVPGDPGELPGTQDVYLCDGPGSCECYGLCDDDDYVSSTLNINKNKATVVLTHGLQNGSCAQGDLWTDFRVRPVGAGKLLNEFLNPGLIPDDPDTVNVNILQYFWKGACHGIGGPNRIAYIKGRQNVYHAGEELAKRLKEKLGAGYSQTIQFIGHSLGTAVNAYASKIFLDEVTSVKKAQITILDYPNKIRQIPGVSLNQRFETLWGFDKDFFATVLPFDRANLTLLVDNYYGRHFGSAGAVGTSITAPIDIVNRELTNPHQVGDEFLPDEGVLNLFDNDHSGVHQWYRWTMRPNEKKNFEEASVCREDHTWIDHKPFILPHSTLNPCEQGWNISSINSKARPFEKDSESTDTPNASTAVAIEFAGGTGNACTLNVEIGVIQCAENFAAAAALQPYAAEAETVPPTVSYLDATMMVPVNARYLTFDYRFTNIGDGDYVYLLVDDKPLWKMSAEAITPNEWKSSGKVNIAMEQGENTLVVALYGVGEQNAQLEMKNFQFIEVLPTFADVPPAHPNYGSVEALADASIAEGCNDDGSLFCPDQILTRDTLALWLMKAKMGESYTPDSATGLFNDVPTTSPFADWIEAFSNEGFTEGCDTNLYCPNSPVDKAQLAKLLLITLNGTGYTPDTATGELFDDVGIFDFNADWIEDAAKKGLLEGCGYKQFCPDEILSRSAMARILENAF